MECVSEDIFSISRNKHTKKKKNENTKKAKETKEEKIVSLENQLKKIAAARVKIFLVTRISGNKSFFSPK